MECLGGVGLIKTYPRRGFLTANPQVLIDTGIRNRKLINPQNGGINKNKNLFLFTLYSSYNDYNINIRSDKEWIAS
jgi:hypothetical protein